MDYKSFLRGCLLAGIFVGCAVHVSAQTASLSQIKTTQLESATPRLKQLRGRQPKFSAENCFGTHELRPFEIITPTILVGASALFLCDGAFTDAKLSVHGFLSAEGRDKIGLDDYLQYAPMVVNYGLHLSGVRGVHNFKDKTIMLAMSYAMMGILVNSMKYTIGAPRPDGSAFNSFPSGHTATAFMAAEFLNKEYKSISPWIGYAGYAMAAVTGYLRIYNNRHYFNDVIAGACVGVMSVKLSYWLYPKIFKRSACNSRKVMVDVVPCCYNHGGGISICMAW